jgi:hypothetical protein
MVAISDFSAFSQMTWRRKELQSALNLTRKIDSLDAAAKKCDSGGDETRVAVGRLTGMRSLYFCRMRSASALRFSKGCSSLNFDRMVDEGLFSVIKWVLECGRGKLDKGVGRRICR